MPEVAEELEVLAHIELDPAEETNAAESAGGGLVLALDPAEETIAVLDFGIVAAVLLDPAEETDETSEIRFPQRREVPLMALIDARPTKCDIGIYRGDRFEFPLTVKDAETGNAIDVSAWGITAQVRAKRTGDVEAEFAANDVDAGNGFVLLALTGEQTRALTGNRYVWDVARTDTDRTLISGDVFPSGDVTRDE